MPPEINFGQPQDLSHTTESPWEQAALIENSADLRSKSAVFTSYDGRSGPSLRLGIKQITMAHECVILADCPGALVELCGISTLERLLRTLQRCGIARVIVLSSTPDLIAVQLAEPCGPRAQLAVTVRNRPAGPVTIEQIVDIWPDAVQLLLVVRGDAVFDSRLLQLLLGQNRTAALIDRDELCGAALLQRDWALAQNGSLDDALRRGAITTLDITEQPRYSPALRRTLKPFCFLAPSSPAERKIAERVLVDATQKGSQDFPALIHAPLEKFLVSHLCKTSITPHQLTIYWIILGLATTILFVTGHLVWGIVLALIVGILDGLDGKQARLKVETSKSGKLEHRFDSLFEVAWPSALAYHFYTSGQLLDAFRYLLILIVAEALDGIGKAGIYFAAEKSMEQPVPFDRIVRLVGGRRNIYVWLLAAGVILGAPAKAFIVMAWWEVWTAAIDIPHALWALSRLQREGSR
jgi:phosphatidylglycerophosphate synthase